MNSFGISFNNRTKTIGADAECPARASSQFISFAALCHHEGVSAYVKGVEYESNSCSFWIDVDDEHEMCDVGGTIEWAADKTLSQFIIFGRCEHKGGLDKPLNPAC